MIIKKFSTGSIRFLEDDETTIIRQYNESDYIAVYPHTPEAARVSNDLSGAKQAQSYDFTKEEITEFVRVDDTRITVSALTFNEFMTELCDNFFILAGSSYSGYDSTLDSIKVLEQSAIPFHIASLEFSEDYLVASGVGQVYWLIPMSSYRNGSIYVRVVGDNSLDDTIIKIYSTNDENVTQPVTQALLASEDWDDVTQIITNSTSFNPNGDNDNKYTWFMDTSIRCKFLVVEFDITAIGGTDINFKGLAELGY